MTARKPIAFHLDEDSALTLQSQIRQKIAGAVANGSLPPGARLPSSRALADQLHVARNTVVLAYQQLVAEGILAGRPRSGVFVDDALPRREGIATGNTQPPGQSGPFPWSDRLGADLPEPEAWPYPPNWAQYPYPFIDGVFDRSLFPLAEWREASRLSLGLKDVGDWSSADPDSDDPALMLGLRDFLLQRHGIHAELDEILITCSVRAALFIAVSLAVRAGDPVAVEDPGNPRVRSLLRHLGAEARFQPVDGDGLVIDDALRACRTMIVSPTWHFPTNATMPLSRRRALLTAARAADMCVIEYDADGELSPPDESPPTLRGMDRDGRVIRVAGLNALLGPALRMGVLVAPAPAVSRARRLRALIGAAPLSEVQRSTSYYLSLGHYDAAMARLGRAMRPRRAAITEALDHYLPQSITMLPLRNGAVAWIRGPKGIEARRLADEAARRGILIEPAGLYFAARDEDADPEEASGRDAQGGLFRMSITSLPLAKIRPGVAALSEVIRDHLGGAIETIDLARRPFMSGANLKAKLSGASLLCRTIYGTPCTITLLPDGRMTGESGLAGEDRDQGEWWVDGDRWFRRWTVWNYGEATGFYTAIAGDQIKWFNDKGRLVDRAVIVWGDRPGASSEPEI
jgi:GntR family transcriptional regulator/MocR family aminotransferase